MKLTQIIITLLLCTGSMLSEELAVRANLDVAYFRGEENTAYLEVYYSLPNSIFDGIFHESKQANAEIIMNLIVNHNDSLWASKAWKIARSEADSSMASNSIVDGLRYIVKKPGQYNVKLLTRVVGFETVDSSEIAIEIPPIHLDEIELSDIIVSTKISRAEPASKKIFLRGGYEVIPNPALLFGESSPVLSFYFEAYGLDQHIHGDYMQLCKLVDHNNKEVQGVGSALRTRRNPAAKNVEMGRKIISKIPSGSYFLVYGVTDSSENILASQKKKIYIYNPSVQREAGPEVSLTDVGDQSFSELYTLSEAQLDAEFDKLRYLVDNDEKDFYKELTEKKAKADYLQKIWKKEAAQNNMAGAVYRYIYLKRTEEANVKFKSVFNKGWKSDRGRVYLLYGPPYEVQRFPSTNQTMPYEIWTYSSLKGQGGVIFIFSDQTGFKKYQQIHSTMIGELQEPDWRRLITKGISSDYTIPIDMQQ